jgi:hypothetical protein
VILLLYGKGIVIYSLVGSLAFTIQSFYIIHLVYKHFMVSKKESLNIRAPQMKIFIASISLGSLLDWLGIFIFAGGLFVNDERTFFTLGVCLLYIHAIGLSLIFYQLRFISIQDGSESNPKKSIVFLKDLKPMETRANETETVKLKN